MSEPAISVDHVSKRFRFRDEKRDSIKEIFVKGRGGRQRDFLAVDDVSFTIESGKTFGLVGHNGSGKSTMLKLLAGVYRPTSGLIRVNGAVSALIELGAGFHGELTGRENIYLNGAIIGLSKHQIEQSVDEIVDFADIGPFIDVPVKVYSSGMYVRLGFAIAVVMNPEILIVDEIIAVGDEQFQRKCFDYIYKLRREGSTIALVTHALGIARELCDEGVWMDHGKARILGPINEVIDSYLGEVNRQELAKLEEDGPEPMFSLERHGSGEARIISLDVLTAQGKKAMVLAPGNDYILRIRIDAKTDLESVGVGVAFSLDSGMMLAGPNSNQENRSYDVARGESFVDFRIPKLFLRPGSYWVSGSLGSNGHVWDYVDKGWKIIVREERDSGEPGPVQILGRWSCETGDSLIDRKGD